MCYDYRSLIPSPPFAVPLTAGFRKSCVFGLIVPFTRSTQIENEHVVSLVWTQSCKTWAMFKSISKAISASVSQLAHYTPEHTVDL
jgi:hypothetical protein